MTKYLDGKAQPELTIKRGIPIPPSRQEKASELSALALGMEVGDCIDVPYSRTGVASNLGRATGYTLTQRKVGDVLRIWRIA